MTASSPARPWSPKTVLLGILVALVMWGCDSGGAASPSPAVTTAATVVPTPSLAGASSQAPTLAATPTARSCPNPDGGSANVCLGPIDAGTYTTRHLTPSLTYTVPAGWANFEDLPGNFLLLPPGAKLSGVNPGTADYLGVYSSVVAAGHCSGKPSLTVAQTFDGLVGWLKSDPALGITKVHDVTVGGLSGVVMDIVMKDPAGDGCPDGVYADIYAGAFPSDLIHSVLANYGLRVYLLHNGDATLAIEIADAPNGGSDIADWFAAADGVVSTFGFAAT